MNKFLLNNFTVVKLSKSLLRKFYPMKLKAFNKILAEWNYMLLINSLPINRLFLPYIFQKNNRQANLLLFSQLA